MAKHKHDWPAAKKLCRLNQNDIEMAKRLGFKPAALVRARPDPKQRWKLPVKDWVHELHLKRFGFVIGEAARKRIEPYSHGGYEEDYPAHVDLSESQPHPPSPEWPEFCPFEDEDDEVPF